MCCPTDFVNFLISIFKICHIGIESLPGDINSGVRPLLLSSRLLRCLCRFDRGQRHSYLHWSQSVAAAAVTVVIGAPVIVEDCDIALNDYHPWAARPLRIVPPDEVSEPHAPGLSADEVRRHGAAEDVRQQRHHGTAGDERNHIEPCRTCEAFSREKTHQPREIGEGGPAASARWLSLASIIDAIAHWVLFYKLGYNIRWSIF